MPVAEEKKHASSRIKAAAKKHGIDVDDESLARGECTIEGVLYSRKKNDDVGYPDDDQSDSACSSACAECKAGDCSACSHADCACAGCTCDGAAKARRKVKVEMLRRALDLVGA